MNALLHPVADYYTDKVRTHGATPRGADWNGAESQQLRFRTLLQLLPPDGAFSLDDYGCGYGALLDHLRAERREGVDYLGIDLSEAMVREAQARHPADDARFIVADRSPRMADFAIASGIFNVRPGIETDPWERHIENTLDLLHAGTRRGFAFNCLTRYSDPALRREHLYYGDPAHYFDLCKTRYALQVALLHDYGLYEFTVIVRKGSAP